jgi:hypothetical protein
MKESKDIETVIIPESLKLRLKAIGAFLSAAVPIAISAITLILSRFKF